MATTNRILIKSKSGAAGAPSTSDLQVGELAVNTYTGLAYLGTNTTNSGLSAGGSPTEVSTIGMPVDSTDTLGTSDVKLATQGAIKTYVDTQVAAGDTTLANTKIWIGGSGGAKAEYALSGDVTMTNAGVVTIANDAVEHSMLNDNCISGFTNIGAAPANSDELLISDGGTLKAMTVANLAANSSFASGTPTDITVADESSDTTCFPLFVTAATGDLGPKTGTNLTFNSSSGALTATSFVGALTGNVTGTIQTAAQTNITSVGTLSGLSVNSGTTNTCATFTSTDAGAVVNITDNSARSSISQNGTDLLIISDTDNSDADSTIKFQVDSSTKAIITSGGNIGLGINSPTAASSETALHIYANEYPEVHLTSSVTGSNAGDGSIFTLNNDSSTIIRNQENSYIRFDTNGSNERMRIHSGGTVNIPSGITLGSAISSTDAGNTLNDYEEGTFTGGINDFNGTYVARTGTYTKIGNVVTIQIMISGNGGSGSGSLILTSLPFSSESSPSTYRAVGAVHAHTGVVTGGVQVIGLMNNNENKIRLRTFQNNATTTDLNRNGLNSSGWELVIAMVYHTAS